MLISIGRSVRTKLSGTILIAALLAKPLESYSQNGANSAVSETGSVPWAMYLPGSGYYVAWQHIFDAIHVRRVDLSGVPTSDTVSLANTGASLSPRICVNGRYAAVVWEDRVSNTISFTNSYIKGEVFSLDSILSGVNVQFNDSFGDAIRTHPDVDFLNDTTIVVVWGGNGKLTPLQYGIYGQICTTEGNLIGGNFLVTDHIQSGVDNLLPRVVTHNGSGYFIVTWVDNSMGSNRLFGRKFNYSGIAQASSFLVSDDSTMTNMFYYGVGQDTSGGVVATWIADRDTVSRIEWRWYDKNGDPTSNVRSVTGDSRLFTSSNCIDASIDEVNRTVLVWEQNTSIGSTIVGQAFKYNQSPFGAPFRVSTSDTTTSDEIFPRVIFKNNRIFTVWQSNGIQASDIDFSTLVSVSAKVVSPGGATRYELFPCYPNPFNPSTTIRYFLPSRTHVTLTVFSSLGQQAALLQNDDQDAGSHEVRFDGSRLASGVYFYRIQAGDFVQTKRLIELR